MLEVNCLQLPLSTAMPCITIKAVENISEEIFGNHKPTGVCGINREMQEMLKKTKREEIHGKLPTFVEINYAQNTVEGETNKLLTVCSVL